MSYQCEIKELTSRYALSIRMRTTAQDLPQILGDGYGSIIQYLMERSEQPADPPFSIYYNMDMQVLDVEFGFPVLHRMSGKGEIRSSETPTGKAATCLHVSTYNDVEPAYSELIQWIKK